VKIYRVSTRTFKSLSKYIEGDPRFASLKNQKHIIFAWALREFRNLKKAMDAGIRVPEPVNCTRNILLMEYIGNGGPAPLLKDVKVEDPDRLFKLITDMLVKLHNDAKLVHGDLSEFNILMDGQVPVLIDFGQGVPITHYNAKEWLERDVDNVCRYFKKLGLEPDKAEIMERLEVQQ